MVRNKGMKGLILDKNYKDHLISGVPKEQHPSWKGGVHTYKRDGTIVSIGYGKRMPMSRKVWQDNYGEIPQGYVVYHRDGNNINNRIENLELITRKELILRNNG